MNYPEPIRLLVFDLGRVLLRICDDWRRACRRAGITVDLNKLDASAATVLETLVHQHDVGRIDLTTFATAASPVLGLTPDQINAISRAYLHAPFPGTSALIDELSATGMAT